MDIRTLRQFTQLAETLHFGRASEACHVSPSALSRNIRMLEDEAGTVLFERDNRRVALTPAGGLFLDYARDALAQWDAVRSTLLEQADVLHGELSIYCSVTASYSFLFHLLSRFRSDHPAIEIKLHTGDPEHAMQRVQAGSEDIAIGARPDMLPATLAFRSIAETPLVFHCCPRCAFYGGPGRGQPGCADLGYCTDGRAGGWYRPPAGRRMVSEAESTAQHLCAGRGQRGHRQYGQPWLRYRRGAQNRSRQQSAGGYREDLCGSDRAWNPMMSACLRCSGGCEAH